ncbi:unnamed protein product [Effrenium voratum]|nr:unnamed protein product [Effrenium voratum]
MERSRALRTSRTSRLWNGALSSSSNWATTLRLLAEMPLGGSRPDACSFSIAASACERVSLWQRALRFTKPNLFSCNAVLSACAKAKQWAKTFTGLRSLTLALLQPDIISFNVVISSADWKRALSCLWRFSKRSLKPDQSTWRLMVAAENWRLALQSLKERRLHNVSGIELAGQTKCIELCKHSHQWQLALSLLGDLALARVADVLCFSAALKTCVSSEQREAAVAVLLEERRAGPRRSAVDRVWALAQLVAAGAQLRKEEAGGKEAEEVRGASEASLLSAGALHAAFVEAMEAMERRPAQLAALWWAKAVLGIEGGERRLQRLCDVTVQVLPRCSHRELMLVAWGCCASRVTMVSHLLQRIQREMASRVSAKLSKEFIRSLLGVIWSSREVMMSSFYERAYAALAEYGRSLDHSCTRDSVAEAEAEGPFAVYESENCVALSKPSGWQVHDLSESSGSPQLLSLLGAKLDASCSHGFLHRLDVPSSGLVLAAKTYEAFHTLQAQLAAGRLRRGYVALCHGGARARRVIRAPVAWTANADGLPLVTRAGRGKLAETRVEWRAHAGGGPGTRGSAVSLVSVDIATGRRHQIRSHFAFVGHALVSDGKYSSQATFQDDSSWCPRNFLHRGQLAFQDKGAWQSVTEPLPPELAQCLHRVSLPENGVSGSFQNRFQEMGAA